MHSLRAQADRRKYQAVMKHTLELQPNLRVKQAEVVAVETEDGRVSAVVTANGAVYRCRAAVLATGTYLHGRTIVGDVLRDSGPDGLAAAGPLAECCKALGLRMRRFKTGTPPRVNARTVDFSLMELQPGDAQIEPFSFSTVQPIENKAVCYLTYTNERTHAIIRANLDRSPIYSGVIEGRRTALLPVDRDEDHDLPRQAAPPAVHRTDGARHRGALHSGASPPPCRRMCRSRCCTRCRGSSTRR